MQTLWEFYCDNANIIPDTAVCKIYNTKDHNRLLSSNYHELSGSKEFDDALDNAEFVSIDTRNDNVVKVYVRFEKGGDAL